VTRPWTAADLPDQTGRTYVVTGATSGVGRATAEALAGAGSRVVLAVRNEDKGSAVAAAISAAVPGAQLGVRRLDLGDLASVRAFATSWTDPIDVLINNAGVMSIKLARTDDGFELQLGTNHLGHFALTDLVLPMITDRVVVVASNAHKWARIDFDDLNWERRRYRPAQAYGQSKLANLLFALELDRRLRPDGRRAIAVHPGWARSSLGVSQLGKAAGLASHAVGMLFGQSAEMGALPTLYAAVQDLPGGCYVGPDGRGGNRGYPALVGRTAAAADAMTAHRLWDRSEELTAARSAEK
jgi:NAD(P)-dependent dehydrogenase (short-subunit alcohol dehydrogenase family)